jgi:hypothetical protein
MFEPNSRYYKLEIATRSEPGPDGEPRTIRYVRRRFIPQRPGQLLAEHHVVGGDRLDNLAARYLGEPRDFWRLCDANEVLSPDELTDEVGRVIRVSLPDVEP